MVFCAVPAPARAPTLLQAFAPGLARAHAQTSEPTVAVALAQDPAPASAPQMCRPMCNRFLHLLRKLLRQILPQRPREPLRQSLL